MSQLASPREESEEGTDTAKKTWETPVLTTLGDVAALTEAGAAFTGDGGGLS